MNRNTTASLAFRHVCHATFEELAASGYTVQSIDDGAAALQFDENMIHGLPGDWLQPEPIITPKAAILKDATLFRDGSALLTDGGVYCNYDPGFRVESWRNRYQQHNLSVMQFIDSEKNDALIDRHAETIPISGRCFAALHNISNNYGHFIHDVLSRIYYEDLGVIVPGREKVIAPAFKFPLAEFLFKKVFEEYEIISFPPCTALKVEELVLPANLCSSTRFNPAGIAALAKRMPKIMEPFAESGKFKICISRRDGTNVAHGRDFINTEDFERQMEKRGYQILEVTKLNPESLISLLASATDMVGVHGAGLMNFIMMLPGSRFTEIAGAPSPVGHPVRTSRIIARCAIAFGHKVNVVASKLDPLQRCEIDLERLEAILDLLKNSKPNVQIENELRKSSKFSSPICSLLAYESSNPTTPAMEKLALRHVCHATFEELSEAGYTIETIDDGARSLQMNEDMLHGMPDEWLKQEPVIIPKVAVLKNATLFEDGSVLLPDGKYCAYDQGYFTEPWRQQYRRQNLSMMHFIHRNYNDALINLHPESVALQGRCFSTLHNCSNNYGQFTHDVLSRIYYEDLGVITPGREKIIAPNFIFPMARILFEKVFSDYEIMRIPPNTAFEVEELVLPANLCSSTHFNPACIGALANRMRRIMEPYVRADRTKICISRRDSINNTLYWRHFSNNEVFESRMEKLGYQIVEASKLDPESQFVLWANATDIVGVHGAGLMNSIMMRPGHGFTEVAGAPHPTTQCVITPRYFARCAIAFGHRVNVVASKLGSEGRPEIDLKRLEAILSKVISD